MALYTDEKVVIEAGAAIATLLSKILEMALFLVLLLRFKKKEYCFKIRDIYSLNKGELRMFFEETVPVILNESLWGVGISSFNMIFGRMGLEAVSAVSVAQKSENLCYSFCGGIGIGACVTVSSRLGEKKTEEAKVAAKRYAVVGFETGILIMLLMFGCCNVYVDSFFKELTVKTCLIAKQLIVVYALYMPFRSLASLLITGVLRAGGDSKYAMYCGLLSVYVWALPVGFLLGIVCKQPIVIVLAAMQFKRVIKCAFAMKHLITDKWIRVGG